MARLEAMIPDQAWAKTEGEAPKRSKVIKKTRRGHFIGTCCCRRRAFCLKSSINIFQFPQRFCKRHSNSFDSTYLLLGPAYPRILSNPTGLAYRLRTAYSTQHTGGTRVTLTGLLAVRNGEQIMTLSPKGDAMNVPVAREQLRQPQLTGPTVSILIPAFNAERWIGDTLRSALSQTWPSKEI